MLLLAQEEVPTANNNSAFVNEDSTNNVIYVLYDDDFGSDGPSSGTISITFPTTNGTATVNNNSTLTDPTDDYIEYTPNADYNGTDQLTYEIEDANGDKDTAILNITVNGVDDPPVIDLNGGDAGIDYSTSFLGSAVNIADTDATGSDPDGTDIETLTLTIGGVTTDAVDEILTIGGTDFALNANDSATNLSVTGATATFDVAVTDNGTTFTITKNGTGDITENDVNALLREITYQNNATSPTSGDRTIAMVLNDGTSDSNEAVSTIQLNAIDGTGSPEVIDENFSNPTTTGDDFIIAGKGEDTLTGGAGNDIYFFNETSEGMDTITDFTTGEDKIDISKILADEVGYAGSDPFGEDYVELVEVTISGTTSTIVQIDFDPADTIYPKDIAFLEGVTGVTSTDFII